MSAKNIRKLDTAATLACIATVLFWTTGPNLIKFLTGHLDFWTQNMLRYLAACLFWLPFLLVAVKKGQIESKIWRLALIPALPNIVMQTLWAASFYYIDPAFMNLLSKSSIIWIAGFSIIFFQQERPLLKSKYFWVGLALSVIGVAGVLFSEEGFATQRTTIGIILALACAFMWSVYIIAAKICFRDIDSHYGFSVMSIYTVVGLCILAFMFGRPQDSLKISAWPWVAVIFSGLTSIGIAHVLHYVAIKRIGATIPSLVLLATPFTVLAISSIAFGEMLNLFQWLFGLILLAGSALAIYAQQHLKDI